MRKIEIEEQRAIELDILDDIHHFCTNNNLRYSMAGGTLLGAVRHHGFIPWDDDVDIIMPRTDYETFIRTYQSELNEILELRNDDSCVELFLKVSRKGTLLIDKCFGRKMWGISVDVFPIDGSKDDYAEEAAKIKLLRDKLAKICPYYRRMENPNRWFWLLKYYVKRILFFYPHRVLHLKKAIDNLAFNEELTGGNKAGVKIGGHGVKEMIDSSIFLSVSLMDFDNRRYYGLSDYSPFLTSHYGDYMQLPPEDERVLPHHYDAYIEK